MLDAHCHPTDTPETLHLLPAMGGTFLIMSSRPGDATVVASAARGCANAVPAYGLHPWYSYAVCEEPLVSKEEHYAAVLEPPADGATLALLPAPTPLSDHLRAIEDELARNPRALVGEVGLDRVFRVRLGAALTRCHVRLEHQLAVLRAHLALAQQYGRAVSVHGVRAHEALYNAVRGFALPAVCLHSYGGSGEFYASSWSRLAAPVYVSVSILTNGRSLSSLKKMLERVPRDRVLAESDYHSAGAEMARLLAAAYAAITECTSCDDAQLERNFWAFLGCQPGTPGLAELSAAPTE